VKFDIRIRFENLLRKFKFHSNLTRIRGTLREYLYIFMTVFRSFVLIVRNFSDQSCGENQNKHFISVNPPPPNCSVYEIMWKNVLESGRPQMMTWRMRVAFCITKARDTLSGYVIFIAYTRE